MFRALAEGWSARIPSQCAVCHAWPSRPVCDHCVARFGQPVHRCQTCALPLSVGRAQCGECVLHPPPLDQTLAAVGYAYPWSRLVSDFKFRERPGWAHALATLMRSAPWVEPTLEQADVLLPMPLSPQRLAERGFNQSLVLARALSEPKTRGQWLLRVRDTPAQSSLPREERLRNVQHAFALDPRWQPQIAGRRVVLVDDVMTTGASLWACARILRLAAAAHIAALVFARTE